MEKKSITNVQLKAIVDKTQEKFKDYFESQEDKSKKQFNNYVGFSGSGFASGSFLHYENWFSDLPVEIQNYFNSEVEKIGNVKE